MKFDAILKGDKEVIAHVDELPKELHGDMLKRIQELTAKLYERVEAVVPEDTGKLKSEIISKVSDNEYRIKGIVALSSGLTPSEYRKAAALEYGSHKSIDVRAYSRKISRTFWHRIMPRMIDVRAYDRVTNIEERLYLRGSLAGSETEFVNEMNDILDKRLSE